MAINYALEVLRSISFLKPFTLTPSAVFVVRHFGGISFQPPCRSLRVLSWEKPHTFSLNVDGPSLPSGLAGGGCVLRDPNGEIIFAASKFFGMATNVQAEILALEYGLTLCREKGFCDIRVDTDSMLLGQMLQGKIPHPWQHRQVLVNITALLDSTQGLIRLQFREANAVADALAKHASTSRTTSMFDQFTLPRRIKGLARLNQLGFPYVRVK